MNEWGESVFNYNVVCCLKLTRYEMRRCLPTLGKSWGRWEKLDTRVDIWWWMIGRPYHWQPGAWAGSHSNPGPGISRVLGLFPPSNFLLLKLFDLFSLFFILSRVEISAVWPWLSVSVANVVRNSFCVQNCTTRYLSKSDLLNQVNTFLHSYSYR